VEAECPTKSKPAARAFLEQAHDYFLAAGTAHLAAAKPVLLYYCFLNLSKALVLTLRQQPNLDAARHGLSEGLHVGSPELVGAYLDAFPSGSAVNMFDEFLKAIRGVGLSAKTTYPVPTLLRQIVTGHRLLPAGECFVALNDVEILDDSTGNNLWVRFSLAAGDLQRLGLSQKAFLERGRLAATWRRVASPTGTKPDLLWFEQVATIRYGSGWLPNAIPKLIDSIRHNIWSSVLSTRPYRTYYCFLPPVAEHPFVLSQLLSGYALSYYFSSITRYRPHHFDRIIEGRYGPFVEAFLHDQPAQMLFLLASKFAKRDVTTAPLV
jgi:hypothetical protein